MPNEVEEKEDVALTAGQIIESHTQKSVDEYYRQEVGETVAELGGKFNAMIADTIQKGREKGMRGKLYVQILERPTLMGRNTVMLTFVGRRSRPTPEQSMYLYSANEGDLSPVFEYCLPEKQMLPEIFMNRHEYTSKYLNDIINWLQNKLV